MVHIMEHLKPAFHTVSESVEKFSEVQTCSSSQHVKLRDSRIGKDEADVQKFVEWIRNHCPFVRTEGLVSI